MKSIRSPHPSRKAIRITQLGMGVSFVLIFVKGFAGYFGNSYALIADATESCADILSSGLLWIGLRVALKEPDKEHPYGHGKAEPIAGIAVALILMGAAIWIAYNSIMFITTPHPMPKPFTLYVLAAVIVVKEVLFRYVRSAGRKIKSQAVITDAFHHRSDAITSVAAFIGVSIALWSGPGYEGADDWAALFASVLIFYNAAILLRPSVMEIMDTAPDPHLRMKIISIAEKIPEVMAIEKCHVRKMGFDYFVDIHIEVDGNLTVTEGHRIAHLVKDALMDSGLRIQNALVHVEPHP